MIDWAQPGNGLEVAAATRSAIVFHTNSKNTCHRFPVCGGCLKGYRCSLQLAATGLRPIVPAYPLADQREASYTRETPFSNLPRTFPRAYQDSSAFLRRSGMTTRMQSPTDVGKRGSVVVVAGSELFDSPEITTNTTWARWENRYPNLCVSLLTSVANSPTRSYWFCANVGRMRYDLFALFCANVFG